MKLQSKGLFRVLISSIGFAAILALAPSTASAQCSGACCKIGVFTCNSICVCNNCTCP